MENICNNCTKRFNTSTRKPMNLPCCHDMICQKCVTTLAQDGKMICPFCKKDVTKDQIFANIYLLRDLEKQTHIGIFCDKHPTTLADLYCLIHEIFLCNKCALIEHHDHVSDLKDMNRVDLEQFCTKAVNVIDEESEKLAILKSNFNSYMEGNSNLTSIQFIQMI